MESLNARRSKILKDEKLKNQLEELVTAYSLILDGIKEDSPNYQNVKKLNSVYIPSLVNQINTYLEVTGDEKYFDRELEKFRNNILEAVFNTKMACRNILRELQEMDIMTAKAEIQANKVCLELDGLFDSFFMTPTSEKETFEEVLYKEENIEKRTLTQDPFVEPKKRGHSPLKEGYKIRYNLAYEYIDDYYPVRDVTNNKFSSVIDDIEVNAKRAIKEVATILKRVLKDVNVCVLPGMAFAGLNAALLELDGTEGINLCSALQVDFDKKKVFINDEVDIRGNDFLLLDSVCRSGKKFSDYKNFLLNEGASSVRCLALAREIDYFPEGKR